MKFPGLILALAGMAVAAPAFAGTNLVVNGSFEQNTATTKTTFSGKVTGWSGGSKLTFIDTPGTADNQKYLAVYGPFPATSPDGGDFVEADGDPHYSSAISQLISGLIVGRKYTLTFDQAAGQQYGFTGATTEQWAVTFGTNTQLSPLYSLPQAGVGPWEKVTMTFTATATQELLSFLAKGTPIGAPPISFLDGVSLIDAVPEPATWAMMLLGFGGLGAMMRRRARKPALA